MKPHTIHALVALLNRSERNRVAQAALLGCVLMSTSVPASAQQVSHPLGLLRPSPERYLNYPVTGIAPTGVLPAQFSLEQFFPPPGSQGTTQGSCTAWSTTFALRTAIEARRSATWRPLESTSRQFSPAFVFNKAKQTAGSTDCSGGIFFDTALEILRVFGAPTLDQFSYDPTIARILLLKQCLTWPARSRSSRLTASPS